MKKVTLLVMMAMISSFALASLTDGLVGYWPFDDDAKDYSGNGNNGITHGVAHTTDRHGNSNRAYRFDGNDFVSIPANSQLNAISDFSVCAWIKASSWDNQYWIPVMSKGDSRQYGLEIIDAGCQTLINYFEDDLHLSVDHNYKSCFELAGGGNFVFTSKSISIGNWTHVAVTCNGGHMCAFVNGTKVGSADSNAPQTGDMGDLEIGRDPPGSVEYFHGVMDEVILYNRALSASEINSIYNDALKVCYVIFNANEGDGTLASMSVLSGVAKALPKNKFYRNGYMFKGWAETKADADNGIVKFRDEEEIVIDANKTLYSVWAANQIVVHFDANGGVFRDKDGNEVTQFDQSFTYGEAQRLFTDELTPVKMDADGNANHFLGWVCGSSAMASSAYLVDYLIDGRAMKTWDNDVSEVTFYAVWTATLTITYYNRSDKTLSPSSLADHLTWRDGSPYSPKTGKSGEPVQIWPGTPNIYLLIDDDYKWVAGQIKFVGRYGVANSYYDSSMCALHNIEIRGGQEYSIDVEVGPSQEFALEGEVVFWHSCAVREELRNLINSQRGNLPDFDPSKVRISIGRAEFNPVGNDYIPANTGVVTGLELYKFYWLPLGLYYLKDVTYDTDTSSGDPYWGALLGPISARLIKSRLIQLRNDDDEVITEYTIKFDVFGGANVARAIFDSREGECTKSEAWFPNAAEGIRVVSEKALPKPKRPGFDFIGWFTEKVGGIKLREGAAIPSNKVRWNIPDSIEAFDHTFTVYAQWTNMTDEWVNDLFPELVFDLNVDVATIATTTAANGKLTVAQCYSCGVNPKDPDDDLKITDFEMKDGKPVITLNHTEDGSGNSFLPRVKTLGKATLSDVEEWREVPEEGDQTMRFFKVEVEMP